MTETVELVCEPARLVLAPLLGGGIAHLDVGGLPVLRPWSGDPDNPFSLASNILVPFSNRISGGGFAWDGERHAIDANLPGEALPIHGDGFQRHWSIAAHSADTVCLELSDGAIGPFRYTARQTFQLSASGLSIELDVTNRGTTALPFGCGFHPWFPRTSATRLQFSASGLWQEDSNHLPSGHIRLDDAPDWSFAALRPLPEHWINNGYSGWNGAARIEQGPEFVSVDVSASDNLSTAIVYSPDQLADFFCFEPVSHPVDAFNLPGQPGLTILNEGETLRAWMRFAW